MISRALRAVTIVVLSTGFLVGLAPHAQSADADPHLTESAITKKGSGRFADLQVTVGKTEHLTNEAVKVAWTWTKDPGSHATVDSTRWKYNYLQIFQCWGDESGPKREQCQFGSKFVSDSPYVNVSPFDQSGFANVLSRIVSDVDLLGKVIPLAKDPLEYSEGVGYPGREGRGISGRGIVPMHAAPTAKYPDGEKVTLDPNSVDTGRFFDQYGTNEIPVARTNANGSGQVFFEAQTLYESQFLGCGARVQQGAGPVTGRSCWLVVVPRDAREVTGVDLSTAPGSNFLASSPLSLSNWKERLTFPLRFEPVKQPCALGGVERPVVGHESLGHAMSSWQSALCAAGQGFFYASTTDDIARQAVASSAPKLSVITDPLTRPIPVADGAAVYAPVAVSGMSIGLFIERSYGPMRSMTRQQNNGSRVERMRLNQRLLAKLLTESYRYATVTREDGPEHLRSNPQSLIDDPEFKRLNQDLIGADAVADLDNVKSTLARIFVPADSADGIRLVWSWILANREAREFLDGKPDEFGMKVNKYYAGLTRYVADGVVRAEIPKLEESCQTVVVGSQVADTTRLCALDAAPFVASLDDGATLVGRGQPKGSEAPFRDPNTALIKFPKPSPQVVGQRALLALTDTPSAEVRGLVQVELPNADGRFVSPTRASMTEALLQARVGVVPGVKRIDPTRVTGAGYPLTRISYAATNPAKLDGQARKDYAQFLSVVTTSGQRPGSVPGTLPLGYAPLTAALQADAAAAARQVLEGKAVAVPEVSGPTQDPLSSASTSTPDAPAWSGPMAGSDGVATSPQDVAADQVSALGASTTPASPVEGPAVVLTFMTRLSPGGTGWLVPVLAASGVGLIVASRLLLATRGRPRRSG